MMNVKISGQIQRIIFENESGFKILLIGLTDSDFEWDDYEIVVKGQFGDIFKDTEYEFSGELIEDPKFGNQINVNTYRKISSTSKKGLVIFFSSDRFPGVGEKTAEKIIDKLGVNAMQKITNDKTILNEFSLNEKTKQNIYNVVSSERLTSELFELWGEYSIDINFIEKVVNLYGEDAKKIIVENPYQPFIDDNAISFNFIDSFASNFDLEGLNDFRRIKASIIAALKKAATSNGDVFLRLEELTSSSGAILGDQIGRFTDEIESEITNLINEKSLVRVDDKYYLPENESTQKNVIKMIGEKINNQSNNISFNEIKSEFILDAVQIEAIQEALSNNIFLLTGGPGTGKTTIIRSIIENWEEHVSSEISELKKNTSIDELSDSKKRMQILLAAPTGKAAKRMSDLTGFDATTIHRMVGITALNDDAVPEYNSENKLVAGLIIIDESSMMDLKLFEVLLDAIDTDTRLILVGDKDQLPPIGIGEPFADLIESKAIKQVELQKIYRQGKGSSIPKLAHQVKNGEIPNDLDDNYSDKSFVSATSDNVLQVIDTVLRSATSKGYTASELQLMSPVYARKGGVNSLNEIAQTNFNPKAKSIVHSKPSDNVQRNWKINDRVMWNINDAENELFNGDVGIITGLLSGKMNSGKEQLIVNFYGREVSINKSDYKNLSLAYATTVHKSQGSEYRSVLIVLLNEFGSMVNRNLLYTALTRASESVVLVGELSAYKRAIDTPLNQRNSNLAEEIIKQNINETPEKQTTKSDNQESTLNSESKSLTIQDILKGNFDPMIGMQNNKIKDFSK